MTLLVAIVDALHFRVIAPCGEVWWGMRHTPDVRIVADRAMDHTQGCERCREAER